MNKSFKDAFEAGLIEETVLPTGEKFSVEGVQYYQATQQGINMLMGRFHQLGDTLRRHDSLKLSGELMKTAIAQYTALFRRIRAQANIDVEQVLDAVGEGLILTERLEHRMAMGLSVEQVYEIASIWYFSEEEDPAAIDSEINRAKIVSWTKYDKAGELYAFFLRSRIGDFVPLTELSDVSILNYIQEAGQLELLDLTRMLLKLKMNGASNATMSILESRTETLSGYDSLLSQLLSSTTTIAAPSSEPN